MAKGGPDKFDLSRPDCLAYQLLDSKMPKLKQKTIKCVMKYSTNSANQGLEFAKAKAENQQIKEVLSSTTAKLNKSKADLAEKAPIQTELKVTLSTYKNLGPESQRGDSLPR